ncbi:unnamed protein product [Heligmosomoides polygyrus]|uniref:Orn_Arg_deC_N domain-containing protein n=1 Tax=Heligmosomoides polygyrus TaxID=6339 RepID=A0A183FW36_HELPZ|nr:unnamed protein product [Heligmosomoides polygyrus]
MAQSLENARKLLDYGRMLGHPVDILDIGGGFMATAPNEFLKIGHFIENTLSSCFEGVSVGIIAEPGRFFVTDAQYVATTINQVIMKPVKDYKPDLRFCAPVFRPCLAYRWRLDKLMITRGLSLRLPITPSTKKK